MFRKSQLVLLILLFSSASLHAGEPTREGMRRAAERQGRVAALKSLDDVRKKSLAPYITALNAIGQWLVSQQATTDAAAIAVEMESIDNKSPALAALKKSIADIPAASLLDEAKQKDLAQRLKTARKTRASGLFDLASASYRAGLSKFAYDLVREVPEIDPDHAGARKALGMVKTPDGWQTLFAATQLQKGNVYLPELGWVPKPAAERVKAGEWLDNGKWMALADADKLHSSAVLPWVIETQNFSIKSTAGRKESIKLAEHIEAFHQLCFEKYLDFFLRASDKRAGPMVFHQAYAKKMQIVYFDEKKDFDAFAKKEFKALAMYLALLPGYYHSAGQTLYYSQLKENPLFIYYLQHELTSQILCTHTQAAAVPGKQWIHAAATQFLTFASAGTAGQLTLADGREHPSVQECVKAHDNGTLPMLSAVMPLDHDAFHKPPAHEDRKRLCGALTAYLLHAKDGFYASDYLEFLYDSYKGNKSASLSDYIGLDIATLEKELLNYITGK